MSKSQSPKLHLPPKIKSVQSPLSWLEDPEILKDVPEHLLKSSKSETLQSYINFLLQNSSKDTLGEDIGMGDFPEEDGHGGEEGVYVSFRKISYQLNESAMFAYTEKYEESQSSLQKAKTLRDRLYQIDGVKAGHRLAVDYCIEALEWSIKELQKKPEVDVDVEVDQENSEDEDEEEVEQFRGRWEDMMVKERGAEAVVAYFKARLAEVLMVGLDKVLEKMEGVAVIDPYYFEWFQGVYQLLKRIRRGEKRNLNNEELQRPCEKESLACRKAYELAPDNFQCISNVALLIKDGLWTMEVTYWEQEEDDVLLCVKLLREALRMVEEKNLKRYICKTKLYLADFLLFGKGSQLLPLQNEGKSLLNECEALYPQAPLVWHKLAKLYHYGATGSKSFKDTPMAWIYYKKCMEASPNNFACLMGFMKLVKAEAVRGRNPKTCQSMYKELLDDFRKHRDVIQVDHQLARLCALEGCIVWIYNPWNETDNNRKTNACRVWLQVFKKWPGFAESLCSTIAKPPFYLRGRDRSAYVSIPVLMETLKNMKAEEEKVRPEENLGRFISTFIEGLRELRTTLRTD